MDSRAAQIKTYLDEIENIIRRDRDISFADIESQIKILLNFFDIYYSSRTVQQHYSEQQRQDIESYVYGPFSNAVDDILERESWGGGAEERLKQEILSSIQRAKEQNYITVAEAAHASSNQVSDERQQKQLKESRLLIERQKEILKASEENASEFQLKLSEQLLASERKLKEVEKSAANAQKALAKQIRSSDGKEFLADSAKYGNAAKIWLIVLIVVAGVAAIFLSWLVAKLLMDTSYVIDNPILSTIKIAVVGFSVYIMQLCSRNYNANKHLETLNKQRATVLAFINTFVSSVDHDGYKDYLLTYAARTVFDHGETGFITRNYGAGSTEDNSMEALLSILGKNQKS